MGGVGRGHLPRVERAVTEGVARQTPYEIEYRVQHHDGQTRWVCERGHAVYDPQRTLKWLDGVIIDGS